MTNLEKFQSRTEQHEESAANQEHAEVTAVRPILPNEDVDVTAAQPLPLGPVFASDDTSDAVEVRPFPFDEELDATAVQPIVPNEELEVTAVQPIQPNQDTANTDFSSRFTSIFDDGYYSDGVMTQLEGFGIGDLLANDLYSKPTNTANNAHLVVETGEGFDPASETTTNLPDGRPSDFTPEMMPIDNLGVDLIV